MGFIHIESLFVDIEYTAKSDLPYRDDLAINLLEQLLIRKTSIRISRLRKLLRIPACRHLV